MQKVIIFFIKCKKVLDITVPGIYTNQTIQIGSVVQLDRTGDFYSQGRGFESFRDRHFCGGGCKTQEGLINPLAADYRSRPGALPGTPTKCQHATKSID